MTGYFVLWLSVFVFIGIGMLTNLLFFRSTSKRITKPVDLDNVLFEDKSK